MNDDAGRQRRRGLVPRVALLACLALIVASLGLAWTPGRPAEPAEPPFSEQARSTALAESLRLRAAGEQLGRSETGAGGVAVARTVTLLTQQARALLIPGKDEAVPVPLETAARSASTSSAGPSGPSPAASVDPSLPPMPASTAALAAELAASASRRLADAAAADGGMARLLAAVGTAQLLQASSLAAAAGAAAPVVPEPAAPPLSGACPSGPPSGPAETAATAEPAAPSLSGALAATVTAERKAVYSYQVALPRLAGQAPGPAPELLARHGALARDGEELSRLQCVPDPPREAGYAVTQDFLSAPGAGLGALEISALPVYGDLVGFSDGMTRQWALAGLLGAARRAAQWGAESGPLPGLAADPDRFPELPVPAPTPGS